MKHLKNLAIAMVAALFAVMANAQTTTTVGTATATSTVTSKGSATTSVTATPAKVAASATVPADVAGITFDNVGKMQLKMGDATGTLQLEPIPVTVGAAKKSAGGGSSASASAKASAKVVAKTDPLPGRLLTVHCDGAIRSAPIPTRETRVELVGDCTPVRTIVEDRRVAQVAPAPVAAVAQASATAQASAVATATASAGAPVAPATFQATGDNTCHLTGNGRTWFNSPDGKTTKVYSKGEVVDTVQKPQPECNAWYQARGRELAAKMCGINLPGGKVAEIPVSMLPSGTPCHIWTEARGREATGR